MRYWADKTRIRNSHDTSVTEPEMIESVDAGPHTAKRHRGPRIKFIQSLMSIFLSPECLPSTTLTEHITGSGFQNMFQSNPEASTVLITVATTVFYSSITLERGHVSSTIV